MIISSSNSSNREKVTQVLEQAGFEFKYTHLSGEDVWVLENYDKTLADIFRTIPEVKVNTVTTEYQLASREWKSQTTINLDQDHRIGGGELLMIAGPCAVETDEQIDIIASGLSERGIKYLRGGAYKPRTSPYSFQGLGKEGLVMLKKSAEKYRMKVVTEVLDLSLLEEVAEHADILQIGTRNMFNYHFLKALGKIQKPVILKRGFSATVKEWLLAAEYILLSGNAKVILCERGIRTFDTALRNTLDLGAIALMKELSHLPVIADPSQGTGKSSLVGPLAGAAIAAGADGLIVEVHHDPQHAWSDGYQSLSFAQFDKMLTEVQAIAKATGKNFDINKIQVNS